MYISKLQCSELDKLYTAILGLDSLEACYRFFDDLCSVSEIQAMAQRFFVAALLDQGMKYQQIAKQTGASTATISRVNRCLTFGADGYRIALEKMKQKDTETHD